MLFILSKTISNSSFESVIMNNSKKKFQINSRTKTIKIYNCLISLQFYFKNFKLYFYLLLYCNVLLFFLNVLTQILNNYFQMNRHLVSMKGINWNCLQMSKTCYSVLPIHLNLPNNSSVRLSNYN